MNGSEFWEQNEVNFGEKQKGSKSKATFKYTGDGEIATFPSGKLGIFTGCWCNDFEWDAEKRELTVIMLKKKKGPTIKYITIIIDEPSGTRRNDFLKVVYE